MIRAARWLVGRVADVLHAKSDADHRARGWQVRRGEWGGRRYRLDVASWLDAQLDRAGDALTRAGVPDEAAGAAPAGRVAAARREVA